MPRKPLKVSRHQSACTVCAHPERQEIEHEFVSWKSPAKIAAEHKLRDRSSVYRHARALGLNEIRGRNLRAALGRLIERVDNVPASAGAVVQAIALLAKINSRGELVEPRQQVGMHELFSKMTPGELLAYAERGTLPVWFAELTGGKVSPGPGGGDRE
jgi:hypothetical protein